jgi:hypothetical protein
MALTISKSSPRCEGYPNNAHPTDRSQAIDQLCRFVCDDNDCNVEIETCTLIAEFITHTVRERELALARQRLIERVDALRELPFVAMLLSKGYGLFGHQF